MNLKLRHRPRQDKWNLELSIMASRTSKRAKQIIRSLISHRNQTPCTWFSSTSRLLMKEAFQTQNLVGDPGLLRVPRSVVNLHLYDHNTIHQEGSVVLTMCLIAWIMQDFSLTEKQRRECSHFIQMKVVNSHKKSVARTCLQHFRSCVFVEKVYDKSCQFYHFLSQAKSD